MTRKVDRRDFIKKAAATSACLSFAPGSIPAFAQQESPTDEEPCSFTPDKSRVVEVSAPGALINGRKPDDARVRQMVEKGILKLTGEKDLASAWRCFVNPDDIVGLKPNGGAGMMATRPAVVKTVIDGLLLAGVPARNIILWEQVEEWFLKYYIARNGFKGYGASSDQVAGDAESGAGESEGGVRAMACTPTLKPEHYEQGKPLPGYDTEPVKFPWGEIRVAEFIEKKITAIINLPVLKDHRCSGVTLALKNLSHAVVNIPWHCHADSCDPYIADIVSIPTVRDKLRLHILDGLLGMADGGPSFRRWDDLFVEEKILLSRDPVAIDTIGSEWVVRAREKKGLPPLEEADNAIPDKDGNLVKGRPAKHIATAAARGLGTNDRNKIEIARLTIPAPQKDKKEEES